MRTVAGPGGREARYLARALLAALATIVVASGCVGQPSTSVPSAIPSPSPSPGVPASTAEAELPATTSSPPAATPSPSAPGSSAEPFDLVWFSDSNGAFAQPMAERIAARLGVEVRLHDFWGSGGLGSATFIKDLIEIQAVEDALKGAEMIVLYTNPGGTKAFDESAATCFILDPAVKAPEAPRASDFTDYADRLRAIYDRIFMLRGGSPVIVRAVDAYAPVKAWSAAGVEAYCTALWETWTQVARDVAAEYGVPMASMYDAFNGPGHDLDPADRGYIGADGAHPSDAGRQAQVDVVDELGYAAVDR